MDDLPEIYQNIYGHTEYDESTSRRCREREAIIKEVVNDYRKYIGKDKIKVLDLGCAQGYYSLTLAEDGCSVEGVDFLDKNVKLCKALQAETGLDCRFREQEINLTMIDEIKDKSYDIILFFSVVHHICNNHGFKYARKLFSTLAEKANIVLTELAVKSEPMYWNKKLPREYEEWFTEVIFYKELAFFETHLSDIARPFLIYSNEYCYANSGFFEICEYKKNAHSGKYDNEASRYYICENNTVLIKLFRTKANNMISELETELNFIKYNTDLSFVPKVIGEERTNNYLGVVTRIHFGKTLRELIKESGTVDLKKVFTGILQNCTELEKRGFYQGDLRAWNICVDEATSEGFIIDFGFIQMNTVDHILQISYQMPEYPITVYDAFAAMVYDCLRMGRVESVRDFTERDVYLPTLNYDLECLPVDYANFFKRYLALDESEISFEKMRMLFESMNDQNYHFSKEELKRIKKKLLYAKYLSTELNGRKWKKRFLWMYKKMTR